MLSLLGPLTGSGAISAPSASPTVVEGVRLASPRTGTFTQQVQLVGDVEARTQLYLAPAFSTKLEMLADDGAPVKKGEIVARLDVKSVEDELDEQVLSVDVAKSAVVEHDRTTAADKVRFDAERQRAQATVDQKALTLRQLEQGTRPEELRKRLLARDIASRARELSRSTLGLKEKLAAKGISTQLEVLQARLDLSNKERDYRVAEASYQQGLAGPTPLARQIARIELEKAKRQLSWSIENSKLSLDQATLTRNKLVAQQGNVSSRVKLLQQQIQQAVIKAPIAGTVVLNKSWTNEGLKRVTVGDDVQQGNPFMSVADLSKVVIRTELDETLLRDIKIGMPATIQLPSQRGKRFSGKVNRIGVLAHERSNRENTEGLSKVFDLDIIPDAANAAFKPGTSVDIQLPLIERKNVLLLTRAAIHREGDRHYVLMPDGSERKVTLGDANAQDVVILSGLTAADQVRLPDVLPGENADGTAREGGETPEAAGGDEGLIIDDSSEGTAPNAGQASPGAGAPQPGSRRRGPRGTGDETNAPSGEDGAAPGQGEGRRRRGEGSGQGGGQGGQGRGQGGTQEGDGNPGGQGGQGRFRRRPGGEGSGNGEGAGQGRGNFQRRGNQGQGPSSAGPGGQGGPGEGQPGQRRRFREGAEGTGGARPGNEGPGGRRPEGTTGERGGAANRTDTAPNPGNAAEARGNDSTGSKPGSQPAALQGEQP